MGYTGVAPAAGPQAFAVSLPNTVKTATVDFAQQKQSFQPEPEKNNTPGTFIKKYPVKNRVQV